MGSTFSIKSLFANGLAPSSRMMGTIILLGFVAFLILLKYFGLMPAFLDELPQHSEGSSIDTLGDAGKDKYSELVPFGSILNTFFDFIRYDLGVDKVTRFISGELKGLINIFNNLLLGGKKGFGLPGLPWTGVAAIVIVLGYFLKGWKMAILSGVTAIYFAVFGMWVYAMETLSLLMAAVPISIIIGLFLGVLAYQKKWVENLLLPIMNVAQTLPHFAYLIPVVVFFGIGHQTGVIATIIFAVPPMVRLTMLGLQKVPSEIIDAGRMAGCSKWQLLFRVQLPTARNEVMLGVNQVIMQCLAMVVIAAFIGASGLGYRLLFKLQSLKIGQAVEIGIGIVLLAIVLDRLSYAWAEKKRDYRADLPFLTRFKFPLMLIGGLVSAIVLSKLFPSLNELPKKSTITFFREWDALVDFTVIYLHDYLLTFRYAMVVNVLTPLRDALLYMPYISIIVLIGGAGLILGGLYSSLLTISFFTFIALSGWWDRAMITAYMVLFSVLICVAIGIPLGIWASRTPKRAQSVLTLCDTFQTFPSFIYLLPVIMLFQVNDLSAIISVIVYAMIPAVRYTVEGIKNVPPELHEAVTMAGCSKRQRLFQLELPVALPHIMLGINQTTMFAFSMVIIAAFIGTIDLGQSIFKALSETDVGKGLVLGLCVSFMALAVDHLITRWAREKRALLGLD
ncbi:MAG: ABC transporter permease subunit [Amylibacter sp.]|nr:ABC transporter permease subunit [Amylibacter sp.]